MSRIRDYLMLGGISGLVLAADQWTKNLVRSNLDVGESWYPSTWIGQYARIVHWNNTGAAFGILPSGSVIFTIVAVVVAVAIVYYFPKVPASQVAVRAALGFQLGGALGNLTDRLVVGTVTDFISVGSFPVFNIADSSISIGVAILVGAMWIEERRLRSERNQDPPKIDDADEAPIVDVEQTSK